jgi:A/G-specific adenine glycosylase
MSRIEQKRLKALRRRLRAWFQRRGRALPWREPSATSYERIVSEVLLQRTRAETVATIFPSFIETFPDWQSLANASEADLEAFLRPIGLWRRRAKSLLAFAQHLKANDFVFPKSKEELLEWPAVGPYVAAAIAMFEHGQSAALIDDGVARLLDRAYRCRTRADLRTDAALRELATSITNTRDSRTLNWAVLDVVSAHCRPRNPICGGCPLAVHCIYLADVRASTTK